MMISLEQWQSVTVLMLTAFLVTSCGGGEEEAEELALVIYQGCYDGITRVLGSK